MYVCMYACMYVCMYVCMHVRMHAFTKPVMSQVSDSGYLLTQESLRMVTGRVLVVLSGSFTSQIQTGPKLT